MSHCYFVTGTSTEVGKTLIGTGLLVCANEAGLKTAAFKPLASGCVLTEHGWRNDDALALQAAVNTGQSYEEINPVALEPAIAPHIAAALAGREVTAEGLADLSRAPLARGEFVLIEGAGGWRVPINRHENFSELPKLLNIRVIMVVGMTLGCISHALLTAEAIVHDGLKLAGWVANAIEADMPYYRENVDTLIERLDAPLLGEVPHFPHPLDKTQVAKHLDFNLLI